MVSLSTRNNGEGVLGIGTGCAAANAVTNETMNAAASGTIEKRNEGESFTMALPNRFAPGG